VYHGRVRILAPLLLASTVLAAAPAVRAQDDDQERARLHFQAGRSHFERGHYEQAVTEFVAAFELSQRAALCYNIYLSYERLGDLAHAIEYLERYLNDEPEIAERDTLTERLATLRERLARREQEQAAGGGAGSGGGGLGSANDGGASASTGARAGGAVDDGGGGGLGTPALVAFIAGGVGLATFATFGALVAVGDGDLEAGCLPAGTCEEADLDRQDTFALVADVGLGLSVVGAVAGVVLMLVGADTEEAATATSFAPVIAPGYAGGAAMLRF
jgi:tetratricopeptide (TPR) repeat protein